MSAGGAKNYFATNLLQLQNFIKRDPTSYKDEFLQTYHNYESSLQVYLMKPSKPNKQLADLALFVAHVSHCFRDELKAFPQQLIDILKKYATVLNPDMRMTFCRCLMLLRTKSLIEPVPLFDVFFSLMKCNDKVLRKTLYTHMINDTKKIKTKLKNHRLCSQVQQFVFTLTKDPHPLVAKHAINLLIELYRKQIWNDAKTVNVIAGGCFSKMTKVLAVALNFFCGKDVEPEEEKDSDSDDDKTEQEVLMGLRVGKKTKKRQKRTDRALKAMRRDKKGKKGVKQQLSSALNHIYDPQDFAEKLFKQLEGTNESFEMKLSMLEIISRLIGIHALFVSNFHNFLLRFLNPHQREVPKMLWFVAISVHELTPPDTVEPVLKTIANNFITERNSSEVIAVGLNSVREICARCPLAMSEDLLGDLVQYKTYKDKAVSSAAKSLIQSFREINPAMLNKKLRGKPTEATVEATGRVRNYGEIDVRSYVPGAEVIGLQEAEDEEEEAAEPAAEAEEWEECSDDEDDDDDEEEESGAKRGAKKKAANGKQNGKKRKHSDDDEEEEEDESDSEGEWVDVSDEEAGEQVEQANPELQKLTLEEKEKLASKASLEKIFTQEDFKKIRVAQMQKKISDKGFAKNKRKAIDINSDSDEEDEKAQRDGLVPISSITHVNKKRSHDKESRLATVKQGREDRELKFGHRAKEPKLGRSNKEKLKTKSFMMVRHKLNKKHKRSFKDKQVALRNSLLKQKRLK